MFKEQRFKELSWILGVVLAGFLLVLTLSSLWGLFGQWGLVTDADADHTATLSAQGQTFATPDTARFTASVVSEAASAEAVEEENTEAVNAVIAYLTGQGVAEEDIKTVGYNLTPQYRFPEGGERILTGYELRQAVQVRTRNLEEVGTLVSGVVDAGANEVTGVQLFIEDPDTVTEDARAEAIAKIQQKKKEMERELGVRFGRVVGVNESSGGGFMPFMGEAGFGRGGAQEDAVLSAPQIEPGTQEVTVQVQVTYQLR